MTRVYISAKPDKYLYVKSLRDELWRIVDARYDYMKSDPHITVIPPFSIDDDKTDQVDEIISGLRLKGQDVKVNGLSVYKNIHRPRVVMLDIEVDMESEREYLKKELKKLTDSNIRDPVNPHITLFKTSVNSGDVSDKLKQSLQNEIYRRSSFMDMSIESVSAEYKRS